MITRTEGHRYTCTKTNSFDRSPSTFTLIPAATSFGIPGEDTSWETRPTTTTLTGTWTFYGKSEFETGLSSS